MNIKLVLLGFSTLSLLLLTSCASSGPVVYTPGADDRDIPVTRGNQISSDEFRIVAREAVQNAMSSPRFQAFLAQYRTEMNNPNAIPVLKLDTVVNDTDDPSLNTDEMTDMISTELFNAALVDVTLAEGANRTAAIGQSRDIALDANFNQNTVAKTGTLVAARLIMRPKVISNQVRDGRLKNVVRTFIIDMADVQTGLVMWKFNKQLGFYQKKPIIGY